MANHAASYELNMKNRQALSAITELKKSVHHMAADINSELAKVGSGFLSFEALKSLGEGTLELGEKLHKTAENMKVTQEELQTLKIIARDAGKDFGFLEKSLNNLQKARQNALGKPTGAAGKAFAHLGINPEEIQHGRKVDLLSHLMRGAALRPDKGMSDLSAIFGSKAAGALMTMGSKLQNFQQIKADKMAQGAIASDKNIDAVVEAKEAMEDLADIIHVALMPALASLVEFITSTVANKMNNEKDITEMDKEAEALTINKGKQMPSGWQRFKAEMKFENTVTGLAFGSEDEKKEAYRKAKEDYITSLYGQDTYMELMKTHKAAPTFMDNFREAQEKRRAEREKERNGPENVQPTVRADKPVSHAKLDELKADSFVKIGGLMTADTHYRTDRLQFEMADSAKKTADNTDTMVDQLDDVIDLLANGGVEVGL